MRAGEACWTAAVVAMLGLVATSAQAEPAATFSPALSVESDPKIEVVRGGSPVVASDGTNWLVVYDAYASGGGAVGRIVGADGQPSKPPVGLGERVYAPQVVFDGESYVLLFRDIHGDGGMAFLRVSTTGEVLGEPQIFQEKPANVSAYQRVVAAAGGSSVLAAVCDDVNLCQAWIIGQDGALTKGISFPSKFTSLAYSDGTWLVLSIDSVITLQQLDGTGALIDGTTKVLSDPQGHLSAAAAPAADGFAVAWLAEDPAVQLATIDFDGAISLKTPVTLSSFPPHLDAISAGFALRSGQDLQLLDSALAPLASGHLELSSYFGELSTNGANRGLFVEAENAAPVTAALLSLAIAPASLGAAAVSAGPPAQHNPMGSPIDGGWLVAWNEYDASHNGVIRAELLDETGASAGKPFLVADDELSLVTLNPGPQDRSLLTAVGPWGDELPDPHLELFLVGADESVAQKSQVGPIYAFDDVFQVTVASSDAGWLVAWMGEDGLHATRVAADGSVADDTLIPGVDTPVAVAAQGTFYRVFGWDYRRGQVYRDIATSGSIAAETPRVLFNEETFGGVFDFVAAASDSAWWFLGTTPCTSNSCRKRGSHQVRFGADTGLDQALAFTDMGPLVAVDGLALASLFYQDTLQFGLAEPGGELRLVDSFPHRFGVNLSAAAGNRVLLSYSEKATGTWGTPTPRVSVSVVTVTGGPEVVTPAGGGGAGGDDSAGAGRDSASGAPGAGRGGSASQGGDPSDGEAGNDGEPSSDKNRRYSRGCGCRTADGAGSSPGALALALLGAGLLARRRRVAFF